MLPAPAPAARCATCRRRMRSSLWGLMNDDPELFQEQPLMRVPEYDMVAFDPVTAKWRNEFPAAWTGQWSKRLPLA